MHQPFLKFDTKKLSIFLRSIDNVQKAMRKRYQRTSVSRYMLVIGYATNMHLFFLSNIESTVFTVLSMYNTSILIFCAWHFLCCFDYCEEITDLIFIQHTENL